MSVQRGFFDLDERYAALLAAGDPLEKLGVLIDFEIFRPAPDAALQRSDGSKGGRPPLDAVMMFKTLILQTLYGLSDAQAEFQILDRRSFGRFALVAGAVTGWAATDPDGFKQLVQLLPEWARPLVGLAVTVENLARSARNPTTVLDTDYAEVMARIAQSAALNGGTSAIYV